MFLFDWPKIYDNSKGSVVEVVRIFRMIVEKQVPKNKYDPIYRYSQIDFSGMSFMLHPDVLLYHSHKYRHREVAQYISLCALRSAADFIATQDCTLNMVLMPGLNPLQTFKAFSNLPLFPTTLNNAISLKITFLSSLLKSATL